MTEASCQCDYPALAAVLPAFGWNVEIERILAMFLAGLKLWVFFPMVSALHIYAQHS